MTTRTVTVSNKTGLHARPASMFVQTANKYDSQISIKHGDRDYNAKSIMALLSAGISSGSIIDISAIGDDECKAVEELVTLIESQFGE